MEVGRGKRMRIDNFEVGILGLLILAALIGLVIDAIVRIFGCG